LTTIAPAHVKANVDKLNMAHAGVGSVSFTTCLLLMDSAVAPGVASAVDADGVGRRAGKRQHDHGVDGTS
jgi:hypothetical protein